MRLVNKSRLFGLLICNSRSTARTVSSKTAEMSALGLSNFRFHIRDPSAVRERLIESRTFPFVALAIPVRRNSLWNSLAERSAADSSLVSLAGTRTTRTAPVLASAVVRSDDIPFAKYEAPSSEPSSAKGQTKSEGWILPRTERCFAQYAPA